MALSEEQTRVVRLVSEGYSLFITGKPGSSKSFVTERFVENLRTRGKKVAVTALTGIASIKLRGKTLHSFFGIGKGEKSARELLYQKK